MDAFLRALPDVAYVVEPAGRILAVNEGPWRRFGEVNGNGPWTDPATATGRSVFEGIADEATRAWYRALHDRLATTERGVAFHYRCDGPGVERDMLMTVTPLRREARVVALLYQSILLAERQRLPASFLRRSAAPPAAGEPLVAVCSFCNRVRVPADDEDAPWRRVEDYYRAGGTDDVGVTHGICAECLARELPPLG